MKKRLARTFLVIFIGHTLICDVGAFVLGRFTTVDWKIAIPLVIFAALLVTILLERPWRKDCDTKETKPLTRHVALGSEDGDRREIDS